MYHTHVTICSRVADISLCYSACQSVAYITDAETADAFALATKITLPVVFYVLHLRCYYWPTYPRLVMLSGVCRRL